MKICERCEITYTPSGTFQKYCKACGIQSEKDSKQRSAIRLRDRRIAKWHAEHPKTILVCLRCGSQFKRRGPIDKYCGSIKYKRGCAWMVKREKNRAWDKAKYYKVKDTLDYQQLRKRRAKETYHRLKDHYRFWASNRQHRERAAGGDLKRVDWNLIKKAFDYTCPGCNKREPDIKLGMDHKVPLRFGGTHMQDNIQPLCAHCNRSKWCNTQFAAQRISDRKFHLVQYGNPVVRRSNVFYSQAS